MIKLESLADKKDKRKLAQGVHEAEVQQALRDFASGTNFPAHDADYAKMSTLMVVAELRKQTLDPKTASLLDRVLADLSGIDVWITLQNVPLSNPKLVAGRVIRTFVIPQWRNTDFYYVDCPQDAPFC